MENIGFIDKMIRFVIAIVFIVLGFAVSAWWFIVAALALVTALTGWCWLYQLLGISTAQKKTPAKKAAKKRKR